MKGARLFSFSAFHLFSNICSLSLSLSLSLLRPKLKSPVKFSLYLTSLYIVTGDNLRCTLPACQCERVNDL